MLVYILFTYLILVFMLALGSTVDSPAGVGLLILVIVLAPWLVVQLARLVRKQPLPPPH